MSGDPIDDGAIDRLSEDVGDERAHSLMSSAGSFGAVAVARQANAIVVACLAGDSADALARVDDLRGLVDAALGALDARLSSGTGRT